MTVIMHLIMHVPERLILKREQNGKTTLFIHPPTSSEELHLGLKL